MGKTRSFSKRNGLIILAVVLLAVVLMLLSRGSGRVTGRVTVYVDGQPVAVGQLGQAEDIVIRGANGEENVIAFTENGFFMKSSTCPNQDCVLQGEVTADNCGRRALGTRIICLPNRVIAELESDGADIPDA